MVGWKGGGGPGLQKSLRTVVFNPRAITQSQRLRKSESATCWLCVKGLCVCVCVCVVSSTAPVREEALRILRQSITNQQLDLYNQAAADVFGSGSRRRGSGGGSSSSGVRLLASPRLAAAETMSLSEDGLHLPDSANNVVGGTCLESRVGG